MRVTRRDILPNMTQVAFTATPKASAFTGHRWSVTSTLAR
jgi:hypothetical protein